MKTCHFMSDIYMFLMFAYSIDGEKVTCSNSENIKSLLFCKPGFCQTNVFELSSNCASKEVQVTNCGKCLKCCASHGEKCQNSICKSGYFCHNPTETCLKVDAKKFNISNGEQNCRPINFYEKLCKRMQFLNGNQLFSRSFRRFPRSTDTKQGIQNVDQIKEISAFKATPYENDVVRARLLEVFEKVRDLVNIPENIKKNMMRIKGKVIALPKDIIEVKTVTQN